MLHVVALSGGKDSTALALRMAQRGDHVDHYLITPTGDELPSMKAHWALLEAQLGKKLTRVTDHTLDSLIEHFGALPNNRQRWCTRMIKIQPCLNWIQQQEEDVKLYVGLRADEEARLGLYSNDVETVFPLQDWGWGLAEVVDYLKGQGVPIPERTDCARCYDQRLGEWWELWKQHPEIYADAEAQEVKHGHTFRSPSRDTWPAPLSELRAEFAAGHVPAGVRLQLPLLPADDPEDYRETRCRVCSL